MQSIKRDLTVFCALSALTLACTLAFTSPPIAAAAQEPGKQQPPMPQQQPQPQMPDQTQTKASSTFTGTVVKDGDSYSLRDSSGQTYKLDDSEEAKQFVGKTVKVTGTLDEEAKVIHVESIEGAEG